MQEDYKKSKLKADLKDCKNSLIEKANQKGNSEEIFDHIKKVDHHPSISIIIFIINNNTNQFKIEMKIEIRQKNER